MLLTTQHPCEADPSWLGMQWNSRDPSHCKLMYIAPLLLTQTVLTLSPARSLTSQQRNRQLLCCVPTAVNVTATRVFTGRLQIALSPLNLHCSPWEGLSQQPSGTCSGGCWGSGAQLGAVAVLFHGSSSSGRLELVIEMLEVTFQTQPRVLDSV